MRTLAIVGLATLLGCSSGGSPVAGRADAAPAADTAEANAAAYKRHQTECDEPLPTHAVFAAGRFVGHAEALGEAVALLDREAPGRAHGLIVLPTGGADVDEECTAIWTGDAPPAPHVLGAGALASAWLTIGGGGGGWTLSRDPSTEGEGEPRAVTGQAGGPVFAVGLGAPGGAALADTTVLVSTGSTLGFFLKAGTLASAALDRYAIAGQARVRTVSDVVLPCRRVAVRWTIPGLGLDRIDVACVPAE